MNEQSHKFAEPPPTNDFNAAQPSLVTTFAAGREPLGVEATRAAQLCGVSRATWYSLQKAGRLPKPVRLGRRVLWRVEELHQWVAAGCPSLSRWEVMKKGRWG